MAEDLLRSGDDPLQGWFFVGFSGTKFLHGLGSTWDQQL
jgi:hypothetical protein